MSWYKSAEEVASRKLAGEWFSNPGSPGVLRDRLGQFAGYEQGGRKLSEAWATANPALVALPAGIGLLNVAISMIGFKLVCDKLGAIGQTVSVIQALVMDLQGKIDATHIARIRASYDAYQSALLTSDPSSRQLQLNGVCQTASEEYHYFAQQATGMASGLPKLLEASDPRYVSLAAACELYACALILCYSARLRLADFAAALPVLAAGREFLMTTASVVTPALVTPDIVAAYLASKPGAYPSGLVAQIRHHPSIRDEKSLFDFIRGRLWSKFEFSDGSPGTLLLTTKEDVGRAKHYLVYADDNEWPTQTPKHAHPDPHQRNLALAGQLEAAGKIANLADVVDDWHVQARHLSRHKISFDEYHRLQVAPIEKAA